MAVTFDATRVAVLTAELDNIAEKRMGDEKWFDLTAEGKLTLRERPLDCIAIVCEVISRIWHWVVSWFCTDPAALEGRMVALSNEVEEYLSAETDKVKKSGFICRYTPALNALYQSAERMGLAGRISGPSAQTIEDLRSGLKLGLPHPTLTSRLINVPVVDKKPDLFSFIYAGNRSIDQGTVAFTFANREGDGYQWRNFLKENEFNKGQSKGVFTHAAGYFQSPESINEVSAKITHTAPLPNLHKNYRIEIGRLGEMHVAETGDAALEERGLENPILHFENRGDKGVEVRIPVIEHQLPASAPPTFLKPGESFDHSLLMLSHDVTDFAVSATWSPPKVPFALGCRAGMYQCEVDGAGSLQVGTEALEMLSFAPCEIALGRPLTHNISFMARAEKALIQTMPFNPAATESSFQIENGTANMMRVTATLSSGDEAIGRENVFVLYPGKSATQSLDQLIQNKEEGWKDKPDLKCTFQADQFLPV